MGMQWNPQFGDIGQYVQGITMGDRGGKQREPARGHYAAGGYGYTYGYGPPAYPPQKPSGYAGGGGYPPQPTATGWEGGAYESRPQKPPSYDGYPPQPAAGWDDGAAYKHPPREPPAYGEHPRPPTPPRHPVAWDDGAHKSPPSQQQGNKKPGIKQPGTGQEPLPNASNEVENMPKPSPKHEGKPPSAVDDHPRKQPSYGYGHSHPSWGSEGAYYHGGGGGYYPPTQARGYPPPCLPPPYKGTVMHASCLVNCMRLVNHIYICSWVKCMYAYQQVVMGAAMAGRTWGGQYQHLPPELMLPMEPTTSTMAADTAMAVVVTAMAST
ncbi:unnamed protein product [Urochloa decumbens]|uniref:Uncharacterized protein n=1 Tax=Urochloa decumbens TaxID=240449 RepID=A0ABC9AD34_9POAL